MHTNSLSLSSSRAEFLHAAAYLAAPESVNRKIQALDENAEATRPRLPVGSPGKVGALHLEFESRDGKTFLASRSTKAPMVIMRPLYIDPADPTTPTTYLMTTGGGLAHNDRQLIRVGVGKNGSAHAVVTTQAATKIHRMDIGLAISHTELEVGEDSCLEYLPDQTIAFGGSRSHSSLHATVARGGCLILGECMTSGRRAHGEDHDYDLLSLDTRIEIARGERMVPVVIDRGIFEAHDARTAVRVRDYPVWATLWIVAPENEKTENTSKLLPALREVSAGVNKHTGARGAAPHLASAVSTLPYDSGVCVRILAGSADEAKAAQNEFWSRAREILLGTPAFKLRKY